MKPLQKARKKIRELEETLHILSQPGALAHIARARKEPLSKGMVWHPGKGMVQKAPKRQRGLGDNDQ